MGFVFKAVKSVVKAVVGVVKGVVKVLGKVVGGIIGLVRGHGNAKNKATDDRLSKKLEPEDNRKIIFGNTAFGCDLRFWEIFNPAGETAWNDYAEVIACATHRVNSFGQFYAEDQAINFDASGNQTNPKFVGLTRKTNNGAIGNAALSVGSGTYWTGTSTFDGCAHYRLHWKTDEKKLPGGVPSRYTQVGEGAPVYDPRKDSTRGGSGTHRVDDQTTWDYAALDSNGKPIGRNNALQMLWYLIGWRISGRLVAGRGIDVNDINWPEMIAAANDAEARQYYTDMILSTGDSHETNEAIISCDGLAGELLDPGGLWTYKVTKDDTADIAVTLGDDDVLDGADVEWTPAPSMGDQFNEVAGTFIDPSTTSLYQSKAYPTVTDATYIAADGFRKRVTHDFQAVQDVSLAQKLARIKLNRSRFPGTFKATFNYRALKAQVWSNVRLSLERYGFVSKLFRVYSQTITDAGIEMELREEDPSVYANGTVTVPASPGALAGYDPFRTWAITTLAASTISQTQASNNRVGVHLSWDALPTSVRRIELQYKRTADSVWVPAGYLSYDATTVDIVGLLGTTGYDFQLRTWSDREQPGPWATISKTTTALSTDWSSLNGTAPSTVTNASISINSNGALVGGGGGQVTIGGLGYTGDLNATYGASWAGNVSGVPQNLGAITGNEQLNNRYAAIGANLITDTSFNTTTVWNLGSGTRVSHQSSNGFAGGVADYCVEIAVATGTGGYVQNNGERMPCVPGMDFVVHCDVQRNAACNGDANFGIWFYQADGTFISSIAGAHITPAMVTAGGVPQRFTRTVTPPANAAYGIFRCFTYGTASPAGHWRFENPGFNPLSWSMLQNIPANLDSLIGTENLLNNLISIGANGTLTGAGGGQVTFPGLSGFNANQVFQPNANVLFNGGFRLTNSSGWPIGWTHPTGFVYSEVGDAPAIFAQSNGTNVAQSDLVPVLPNQTYRLQGEAYTNGITAGNWYMDVLWYSDAAGTNLVLDDAQVLCNAGGWGRYSHAYTAPSNAAYAMVRIFTQSITFSTGGSAGMRRVKFAIDGAAGDTPFSDEATNSVEGVLRSSTGLSIGAVYITGTAINGIGTGSGSSILNSGVSIGANGALTGGGGGQVTFTGLTGLALTALTTPGSNLVYNGDCRLDKDGWTGSTGNFSIDSTSLGRYWHSDGSQGLSLVPTLIGSKAGLAVNAIPMSAGQQITWSLETDSDSGSNLYVRIQWFNSSNAVISTQDQGPGTNQGFSRFSFTPGAAPAGTTYAKMWINVASPSTGSVRFKRFKVEFGTVATPWNDILTSSVDRLTTPGSGYRLGDGRNIPAVFTAGGRYYFSQNPSVSSAAGTPATATISFPAGTLQVGGTAISYNALSVGVTGTGGTAVTYNLYIDDIAYAGGTKTLVATTSALVPYQNDGRIYLGQITFTYPTSGTSSGTGTGGGGGGYSCVWSEAWVETKRGFIRAWEVVPGDYVRTLDYRTMEKTRWTKVTANRVCSSKGWEIRSEDGEAVLHLSEDTPLTLRDGSAIFPVQLEGQELPVQVGDRFEWRRCFAQPLGKDIDVALISCGSQTYAAGNEQGASIFTHNVTTAKP